eukprot:6174743-Pleurochrysis_carterae.AAC.1
MNLDYWSGVCDAEPRELHWMRDRLQQLLRLRQDHVVNSLLQPYDTDSRTLLLHLYSSISFQHLTHELESTLSSLQGPLLPPFSAAVDTAVASQLSVWQLARQHVEVKVLEEEMIALDKEFDLAKASYGEASLRKANAEAKVVEKASIVYKVRRARVDEAAEAVATADEAAEAVATADEAAEAVATAEYAASQR